MIRKLLLAFLLMTGTAFSAITYDTVGITSENDRDGLETIDNVQKGSTFNIPDISGETEITLESMGAWIEYSGIGVGAGYDLSFGLYYNNGSNLVWVDTTAKTFYNTGSSYTSTWREKVFVNNNTVADNQQVVGVCWGVAEEAVGDDMEVYIPSSTGDSTYTTSLAFSSQWQYPTRGIPPGFTWTDNTATTSYLIYSYGTADPTYQGEQVIMSMHVHSTGTECEESCPVRDHIQFPDGRNVYMEDIIRCVML